MGMKKPGIRIFLMGAILASLLSRCDDIVRNMRHLKPVCRMRTVNIPFANTINLIGLYNADRTRHRLSSCNDERFFWRTPLYPRAPRAGVSRCCTFAASPHGLTRALPCTQHLRVTYNRQDRRAPAPHRGHNSMRAAQQHNAPQNTSLSRHGALRRAWRPAPAGRRCAPT